LHGSRAGQSGVRRDSRLPIVDVEIDWDPAKNSGRPLAPLENSPLSFWLTATSPRKQRKGLYLKNTSLYPGIPPTKPVTADRGPRQQNCPAATAVSHLRQTRKLSKSQTPPTWPNPRNPLKGQASGGAQFITAARRRGGRMASSVPLGGQQPAMTVDRFPQQLLSTSSCELGESWMAFRRRVSGKLASSTGRHMRSNSRSGGKGDIGSAWRGWQAPILWFGYSPAWP